MHMLSMGGLVTLFSAFLVSRRNLISNNDIISFMTLQDWAALILSILSIFAIFAGGIKWMVKHYLSELKVNGGSSVKDQINRLEVRINEADATRSRMKEDHKVMKEKLDHMYDILIEYIAKSK